MFENNNEERGSGENVEEITSLQEFIDNLEDKYSSGSYLFRGEEKDFGETKNLASGYRWMKDRGKNFSDLLNLRYEFYREVGDEISKNKSSEKNFVAYSQHYGLPTEALDVTKNPLVALYFACVNEKYDGFVYIFSDEYLLEINKPGLFNDTHVVINWDNPYLDQNRKDYIRKIFLNSNIDTILEGIRSQSTTESQIIPTTENISDEDLDNIITQSLSLVETTEGKYFPELHYLFLKPPVIFDRMRNQQGLFLYQLSVAIEGKEKSYTQPIKSHHLLKIPSKSKKKIIEQLDQMGINKNFLFSDPGSTAEYLRETF